MDVSKLPIAADRPEDSIGVAKSFKQPASPSHRDRPRIAVEPLGCLSVLDQGDQNGRRPSLPRSDSRNKIWFPNTKQKSQPVVHVQRPRAVLSSPENDDLSRELQLQTEESKHIMHIPPKAPLSLPEEPVVTGDREISVAENSASSMDTSQDNSDVCQSPRDSLASSNSKSSLSSSNSRVIKPKVAKGKPIRQCSMSASNITSARSGNDENLMSPSARDQSGKKHSCMSSAPSSMSMKVHAHRSLTKSNSGRVVRPWY